MVIAADVPDRSPESVGQFLRREYGWGKSSKFAGLDDADGKASSGGKRCIGPPAEITQLRDAFASTQGVSNIKGFMGMRGGEKDGGICRG